jgi:Transmembrane secretion effector
MSFTDKLLLWLHIGFAIFTLGPAAAALLVTPRYIRKRDLAVLRYLYRNTRIFGALTAGVFLFGLLLGRHDFNQAWFTAAMTLFIVAAVLLVLVIFDQRRAITAIDKAAAVDEAAAGTPVPASAAPASVAGAAEQSEAASAGPGAAGPGAAGPGSAVGPTGAAAAPASVERGRIATMGGVITLIWLVILVLMVWHG